MGGEGEQGRGAVDGARASPQHGQVLGERHHGHDRRTVPRGRRNLRHRSLPQIPLGPGEAIALAFADFRILHHEKNFRDRTYLTI